MERCFHSVNHFVQVREISVVQATAPSQFPNSLDRIQLRAVGRQIVQTKVVGVLFSPLLVQPGMMISRVVGDYNHSAPGSNAGAAKAFHERKEGQAIELVSFPAELKFSIPQPHRAEVSHTLPRGSVQQNRIPGLGWNPHLAAGTMLLEMYFVRGPEIYALVFHQRLEFFLCAFCRSGSAWAILGRGLRNRKPNCNPPRYSPATLSH